MEADNDGNQGQLTRSWRPSGHDDPTSGLVVAEIAQGADVAPIVIKNSPYAQIADTIHIHHGSTVYKNMTESTNLKLQNLKEFQIIKTRTSKECLKLLDRYGLVIIEGGELSGKTTTAQLLLEAVSTQHQCTPVILDRPEDYVHIPPNERVVVILDDIFGKSGVSPDSVSKWEKILMDMLQLPRKDNLMLVITSRKSVLRVAKQQGVPDVFYRHETMVHLDDRKNQLRGYEKRSIVSCLVQRQRLKISEKEILLITQSIDHPYLFGCCDYLRTHRMNIEEFKGFLKSPHQFHVTRVQRIADKEPVVFSALVLLAKQGSLPFKRSDFEYTDKLLDSLQMDLNIQQPIRIGQILSSLSTLSDIVSREDGSYVFMHQSVEDAVCLVYGNYNLESLLQWCSDRFLLNHTCLTVDLMTKETRFVIDEQYYTLFLRGLMESESLEIFAHPLFSVGEFVDSLYDYVITGMSNDNIVRVIQTSVQFKNGYIVKKLVPLVEEENKHKLQKSLEIACENGDVVSFHALRKNSTKPCEACLEKACKRKKNRIIVGCLLLDLSEDFQRISVRCLKESMAALIETGDQHNLEMLLETSQQRSDYKTLLQTALVSACALGRYEQYLSLKEISGNVNAEILMEYAIAGGNKDIVDSLVNDQTQEIPVTPNLNNLFLDACMLEEIDIAEMFLDINADLLQAETCTRETSLHKAASLAYGKSPNVLSWLLKKGLEVQSTDSRGKSPLHFACFAGNVASVSLLLAQGADTNVQDADGNTPFHANLMGDNPSLEIVKVLAKHGGCCIPTFNNDNVTPLHVLCSRHDLGVEAILAWILDNDKSGVNLQDCRGNAAIHCLLNAGGSAEILELLVDFGADVNIQNESKQTPLHIATGKSNTNAVEMLIERGGNPNEQDSNGQTALHAAISHNLSECAKILVQIFFKRKHGLETRDSEGQTVLHIAARTCDDSGFLDLLLKGCKNESAKDNLGRTALHIACEQCNGDESVHMVKGLLAKGAIVDVVDGTGSTPLTNACLSLGSKRGEIINLLLQNGADPSHLDFAKQTVLNKLCSRSLDSDVPVLEMLLPFAHFDARDKDGNTMFHNACSSSGEGALQVIKILTSHSAPIDAINNSGDDVISVSLRHSRIRFQELMESVAISSCKPSSKYSLSEIRLLMMKGGFAFVSDETNGTIVHKLCEVNEERTANILDHFLTYGANVDARRYDGMTALHVACSNQGMFTEAIIDVLCKRGAKCNAKDMQYETPLHKIARNCGEFSPQLVVKLGQVGIDPNSGNVNGNTALHLALASQGDFVKETLKELLILGSDLKAINHFGESALDIKGVLQPSELLHLYCENTQILDSNSIRFMVSKDISISSKDCHGETVLHKVCSSKNVNNHANIQLLLESVADANLANENNMTPYDLACLNGLDEETVRLLLNSRRVGMTTETMDTSEEGLSQAVEEQTDSVEEDMEQTSTALVLAAGLHVAESSDSDALQSMHDSMNERKLRARDDIASSLVKGKYNNLMDDLVALGTAELFRGGIKTLINRDKNK